MDFERYYIELLEMLNNLCKKIATGKYDESDVQKLFELAKDVTNCDNDSGKVLHAVNELIQYAKFHFANEELYMKSVNFIYLEEHKQLHKNLINAIDKFRKNINRLSKEERISQLSIIINKNIVPHILTEDKNCWQCKWLACPLATVQSDPGFESWAGMKSWARLSTIYNSLQKLYK